MVHFLKVPVKGKEKFLKINNSWPELFNFQTSFNCHYLKLLRTASLLIHKVIIISLFQDGMNDEWDLLVFCKKTPF